MTDAAVREPFSQPAQQREAAVLGLWIFLATEVMMFGGLFMGLLVYRWLYPEPARLASEHLYKWIGGGNTAVLLTSSLCVALGVEAARAGRPRTAARWLAVTAVLGAAFLGVKAVEYMLDYREHLIPPGGPAFPIPALQSRLFIDLYLASTGLHALHVAVGVALAGGLALLLRTGRTPLPRGANSVEVFGLYWHFVDLVWVFLFPALYLV